MYVVKGKFTPLYITIRPAFLLALQFLTNCRNSVFLCSCTNAQGYGEFSFVFIKSKTLVQQRGHCISPLADQLLPSCANALPCLVLGVLFRFLMLDLKIHLLDAYCHPIVPVLYRTHFGVTDTVKDILLFYIQIYWHRYLYHLDSTLHSYS